MDSNRCLGCAPGRARRRGAQRFRGRPMTSVPVRWISPIPMCRSPWRSRRRWRRHWRTTITAGWWRSSSINFPVRGGVLSGCVLPGGGGLFVAVDLRLRFDCSLGFGHGLGDCEVLGEQFRELVVRRQATRSGERRNTALHGCDYREIPSNRGTSSGRRAATKDCE